jgi:hypothetical protein
MKDYIEPYATIDIVKRPDCGISCLGRLAYYRARLQIDKDFIGIGYSKTNDWSPDKARFKCVSNH